MNISVMPLAPDLTVWLARRGHDAVHASNLGLKHVSEWWVQTLQEGIEHPPYTMIRPDAGIGPYNRPNRGSGARNVAGSMWKLSPAD